MGVTREFEIHCEDSGEGGHAVGAVQAATVEKAAQLAYEWAEGRGMGQLET